MTLEKLAEDEIKIIAGRDDYTIYEFKIQFDRDYFSITEEGYDYNFMDDEEGQQRASDYIQEDDYLWKDAVAHDQTELSKEDYYNQILDNESWTEIVGDITEINLEDTTLYTQMSSCGCSITTNLEKTKLTKDELDIIKSASDVLHLKPLKYIFEHKPLNELLNQVIQIFKKHEVKNWDYEMYEFSNQFENKLEEDELENE